MSEPLPHAAALAMLARIDRALPFTSVVTQASDATVWCADVVSRARAGGDPLKPWRDALQAQQERIHGVSVPPHVPAAFVLQWWCEVVATPIAYAAELGPWVLGGAEGLGFELAPGLHPERLVLLPGLSVEVGAKLDRDARARTAYRDVVDGVVASYAPGVKMSSRQRWGVVEDVWLTARRGALGAAGGAVGPQPRRVSCCFIYALPGLRACAACPRAPRI